MTKEHFHKAGDWCEPSPESVEKQQQVKKYMEFQKKRIESRIKEKMSEEEKEKERIRQNIAMLQNEIRSKRSKSRRSKSLQKYAHSSHGNMPVYACKGAGRKGPPKSKKMRSTSGDLKYNA